MNAHIVVTPLLCSSICQPQQIQVWDGDTFRLQVQGDIEKIRIVNIDAPEIEGKCPYETELAQRAKRRLSELLQGGEIEIMREGNDRYRRTLATIRIDGRDAGDILVGEGLARTWTGRREPWC